MIEALPSELLVLATAACPKNSRLTPIWPLEAHNVELMVVVAILPVSVLLNAPPVVLLIFVSTAVPPAASSAAWLHASDARPLRQNSCTLTERPSDMSGAQCFH
jgi:hypothetical protein